MLFVKFKLHHFSVFQDLEHILLLVTDYMGANKNPECRLRHQSSRGDICGTYHNHIVI